MMLIVFLFLLIDKSHSLEWNCAANKDFLFTNEQCTITMEYFSIQQEQQVCHAHTLAIHTLPSISLSSDYTLKIVRIHFCQLLTLDQFSFSFPSSVEELDLSYNLLSTFPVPSSLKYLNLDHNPNLIEINFEGKLIALSLRHNQHIQLSSFSNDLAELDLTNCNLLQSSMLTLLRSLRKLSHLSLAENQLEQLPILDERIELEYLNLSNNRLILMEEKWLHKHLHILDLSFNQIKSLEFLKIDQTLAQNRSMVNPILQLSLRGNPLICDCWLGSILHSSSINITDLSFLQCNSQPIASLSPSDLLCPYSRHCTSDCTCCDFEACDCHSICPSECFCAHNALWAYHSVQCQKRNLSDIHILLPETVTELNYEENYIEQLKPFVFIGKTLLTKLNLAKNNLRNLTNETFCAAWNLREINLSYNRNLMTILPNINELFGCLKYFECLILSKEQIDDEEEISQGWTIDSDEELVRLIRMTPGTSSSSALSNPVSVSTTPIFEPSTIFLISHQESYTSSSILQHNQTLIITVFFLLLFLSLFLLLLISLALCRRKLRRHLTTELQHQRAHHYYYHQPVFRVPDSNGTSAANDSLYEQLPSLSSDSERPFLYNEKKFTSTNVPALPPYPPAFRRYYSYHPPEYQCVRNTDYSKQQQHQCPATLVLGNQVICSNHQEYPTECLLSKQQGDNTRRFCNKETVFVPTTLCRCHGHTQNTDTNIYPDVHR